MKRWLLIPLLSLAISTQSFAQMPTHDEQQEQILLSYEEFAELTHAEQKTYVKKLREIMIDVASAYPEIAENLSTSSRFYTQLWALVLKDAMAKDSVTDETKESFVRYALGQSESYIKAVEQTKTDKLTNESRGELAARYREALYWSAAAAQYAYTIKGEKLRSTVKTSLLAPNKEKIENSEDKVKKAVGEDAYKQARDDYFNKAHAGKLLVSDPYPDKSLIEFGDRLPASSVNAPAPKKEEKAAVEKKPEPSPTKTAEPKPVEPKPADPKPTDPKKSETKPPEAKTTESDGIYYRCMYAGFVIKKHPCVAPSSLPWDLNGIDSAKFTCGKGTVMCNPFLFGFKTSCDWSKSSDEKVLKACYDGAQPYCVKPGLYATKNCGEISNKDAALEAAVHLIHNNPSAFNLYAKNFGDLCQKGLINFNSYEGQRIPKNTARTKADIARTCDKARSQMKKIRDRYNVFKEKQQKPKASPATPAATKNSKTAK